jgi:calcineurin-like phosphoesterase family protein
MLSSDLHLGHKNICKYRTQFSSAEEHHEIMFDNLATTIKKRDTLWLLGDIAFTREWLERMKEIHCMRKVLIAGNHCLERGIRMRNLVEVYDDIFSMVSHRNNWFSHAPIHQQEIRNRKFCIHGHLHQELVLDLDGKPDKRYINVCVDHTDFKPITYEEVIERASF